MIRFFVPGIPRPQGTLRAVSIKGRARLIHDKGTDLATWRHAVTEEAMKAGDGEGPSDGPVYVSILFTLPRPPSIPKKRRHPDRRPDLDKLIRAVLDSLTGTLFTDDARVVSISADKIYAFERPCGATIAVQSMAEREVIGL